MKRLIKYLSSIFLTTVIAVEATTAHMGDKDLPPHLPEPAGGYTDGNLGITYFTQSQATSASVSFSPSPSPSPSSPQDWE